MCAWALGTTSKRQQALGEVRGGRRQRKERGEGGQGPIEVHYLSFKGFSARLQALLFQAHQHLLFHGHLILVPQLLNCWLVLHCTMQASHLPVLWQLHAHIGVYQATTSIKTGMYETQKCALYGLPDLHRVAGTPVVIFRLFCTMGYAYS